MIFFLNSNYPSLPQTTPQQNGSRQNSQGGVSSGLKTLIDRVQKDSANLSIRSNGSNTPSGIYQSVNSKQKPKASQQQLNQNYPGGSVRSQSQQQDPNYDPNVDEYYTVNGNVF